MLHSSCKLQALECWSMQDTWSADTQGCARAQTPPVLLLLGGFCIFCCTVVHTNLCSVFVLSPSDTSAFLHPLLDTCAFFQNLWQERHGGRNAGLMLDTKHTATPAGSAQSCLEPSHRSARSQLDLDEPPGPPHSCTPATATYKIFPGNTMTATCAL